MRTLYEGSTNTPRAKRSELAVQFLSQLTAKSQALRAGPGTSPGQATSPLEGVAENAEGGCCEGKAFPLL